MSGSYIFDLDRTLYPYDNPIFKKIWESVEQAMILKTGLDVPNLHKKMANYSAARRDPFGALAEEYDFDVHDVVTYPDLLDYSVLEPSPEVRQLLETLPAEKKVVYTDAVLAHAEQALARLELRDIFDAVYDLQFSDYQGKAIRSCFSHVLEDMGVEGETCTMLEDTPENLKVAKSMGIRTILIAPNPTQVYDFVDEVTPDLASWLRIEHERREG